MTINDFEINMFVHHDDHGDGFVENIFLHGINVVFNYYTIHFYLENLDELEILSQYDINKNLLNKINVLEEKITNLESGNNDYR